MATLLDEYAAVARWELSTREANEGYIRRTIKPALGHLQARKIRGPILDKLYMRLMRCGDLSCTGKPFTEHRHLPVLVADHGKAFVVVRFGARQLLTIWVFVRFQR